MTPEEPTTYTTGAPSTMTMPNWDEMLATMREFEEEGKRIDAGLAKSLREYILKSKEGLAVWADRLNVSVLELVEVITTDKRPTWRFWEEVRRVFNPPFGPLGEPSSAAR